MAQHDFFKVSTEQSQVKAAIVAKYFFAWAKVISNVRYVTKIAYIDLFAGPGRYEDGTDSTPLLILSKAISDPKLSQVLVTRFNDRDVANTRKLDAEIKALPGINNLKYPPVVLNDEVGDTMVKMFENNKLVPTLFFVDPWGYKGLSLQLVNSVVKDWACECIFFFNYNRISMGLNNPMVTEHMDALFGKTKADALRQSMEGLSSEERELAIIEQLSEALNPGGKRFVLPFRFRTASSERTSHHLIFVSKNFRGYDIMKGIMAKESSKVEQGVASFEYNPADVRFPLLFELGRPLDELEGILVSEFSGETLSFDELYMRHSLGKPFISSNYKLALKNMEQKGLIVAEKPGGQRRKGTFADDVRITFLAKGSV